MPCAATWWTWRWGSSGGGELLKGEGPYATLAEATAAGAVTLNIGVFVNNVVSFLIVAFAVFLLIKGINRLRRQQAKAPTPLTAPPEEILLLREIRNELRNTPARGDATRE